MSRWFFPDPRDRRRAPRAVIDSHYSWWLTPRAEVTRVPDTLPQRWPRWLVRLSERWGPVRGALVFLLARCHDTIVLPAYARGLVTLLALEALTRRGPRRVVVLEGINFRARAGGGVFRRVVVRLVRRPAARRAVAAVHVLTRGEVASQEEAEPALAGRFVYVPWPWREQRGAPSPPPSATDDRRRVMCSGRAQCDWETLFAAARGRGWRLTVVCRADDVDHVRELNAGVGAEVLSEIPRAQHMQLLSETAVYVVSVRASGVPAGHVRLMLANEVGVPVAVTYTPAFEDYLVGGRTALAVPSGDAAALRDAVERMLEDTELRQRLRDAAWRRSQAWTYSDYLAALATVVDHVAEDRGGVEAIGALGPPPVPG